MLMKAPSTDVSVGNFVRRVQERREGGREGGIVRMVQLYVHIRSTNSCILLCGRSPAVSSAETAGKNMFQILFFPTHLNKTGKKMSPCGYFPPRVLATLASWPPVCFTWSIPIYVSFRAL